MQYLISGEELKLFTDIFVGLDMSDSKMEMADEVFDNVRKQPVEEIAAGEVTMVKIGDSDKLDIFDDYLGQDIKVFVEVSK